MSDDKTKAKGEEMATGDDDGRKVSLLSQEGDSFEVSVGVARMSELVKTMIDGTWDIHLLGYPNWIIRVCVIVIDEQDDDDNQEIPLPNVKSTVLSKVIEFCGHHYNNPMQEIEKVCIKARCTRSIHS